MSQSLCPVDGGAETGVGQDGRKDAPAMEADGRVGGEASGQGRVVDAEVSPQQVDGKIGVVSGQNAAGNAVGHHAHVHS